MMSWYSCFTGGWSTTVVRSWLVDNTQWQWWGDRGRRVTGITATIPRHLQCDINVKQWWVATETPATHPLHHTETWRNLVQNQYSYWKFQFYSLPSKHDCDCLIIGKQTFIKTDAFKTIDNELLRTVQHVDTDCKNWEEKLDRNRKYFDWDCIGRWLSDIFCCCWECVVAVLLSQDHH